MPNARGAYHVTTSGGPVTTYYESCIGSPDGHVVQQIGLSLNGTVAFSQIVNGHGAIYRGPVEGPVAILRSGSGTFYNTSGLDVNDAGRVIVQMEHSDGILRRGVLAFDTPEQTLASVSTAIEKLGIGMNTPKSLTLIADLSGAYCRFGSVDINDSDEVAFEAALDTEGHCAGTTFDGIFSGPNAATSMVSRGDEALGSHQFFDTIVLGELNNAGQVSFITTYSEPLVEPTKVWRADPQ